MKTLLIGLLALTSFSVLADSIDQTARLLSATCNSRYGIAEVKLAIYNKDVKSFIITKLNIVNDSLCGADSWDRPSKLMDMSFSAVFNVGNVFDVGAVGLHNVRINSFGIVTDIQELNEDKGPFKKTYKKFKKFNLLQMNSYQQSDLRIVDLDLVFNDEITIERIPLLIDMGKLD